MSSARRLLAKHICEAAILAAAIFLCLAQSPASAAGQKKAAAHHDEFGKGDILLLADAVVYNTRTGIVTVQGHVEIAEGQRVLLADSVSYDQNTGIIRAQGHVSLLEPDGSVQFADSFELTKDMANGAAAGFAALIGKNGRLAAFTGELHEGRYLVGHRAVFTPCKVCAKDPTPLWQVKAVRIVDDRVEKEIVYYDATFEFMGLPVFYTPYFSQPEPSVKHKSGLLIPEIGGSSVIGTFARVPIYIALSDSEDVTVAPLISSSGGGVLEAEYRNRWGAGGMWLQGSLGYNPNAPVGAGPWESHLFGSGRIPLNNTWRVGFDVQLTSNDTYLRRYEISDQDRLNSDLFLEGISGRSRFAVTGYFFQGLRTTDIAGQIPFVLPLIEYTYIPDQPLLGGQFRFDANGLVLFRPEGEDDGRASLSSSWRLPFVTENGQLFTFEAMARGDFYYTRNALLTDPTATVNSQTVTRGLAFAMLEWRWPFVTSTASGKTNFILEPIVQLIAAPYGGNPKGTPDEDSASFEFVASNLFRVDPFPGLDRWEGGPRANAALHASAIFPTGDVEVLVGQDYHLKADHSLPASLGLGGTQSDIVGQIKVDFSPYIDLTHEIRIDEGTGDIKSNQVDLRAKYGRSFIDLAYLSLPPEDLGTGLPQSRKEINLSASIGVYNNWFLFAGAIRDLEKSEMRDARLGITYQDECFTISLGFRRRFTTIQDLRPTSSIVFRIGLLTASQDKTDSLP